MTYKAKEHGFMLPDFPIVINGSRLCIIEQFGGRNYGRPRLDCRL